MTKPRGVKQTVVRHAEVGQHLEGFRGPSVGLELKKGRAIAVGAKIGDRVEFLILEGEFELPADLARTLEARIRHIDDTRRYVIVSTYGTKPGFWFYYCVESDSYIVGDLQFATAFKRREIAEAVMALLRSEWHEVVECRKLKDGKLKLTGRRRRPLRR